MVIGRARRREHPNQHCLLLLRVLHNFRLRIHTPKGTPKGSNDLRSLPVAMLLLLRKKNAGEKLGMRRTYFRSGQLPDMASSSHVTDVTSGQKAPLGRIWHNIRLHMRRTYFRTESLPVTSLPQMWLCPYPYTTSHTCLSFIRRGRDLITIEQEYYAFIQHLLIRHILLYPPLSSGRGVYSICPFVRECFPHCLCNSSLATYWNWMNLTGNLQYHMARFINFMNSLVPNGIVHLLFLFSHFNSSCKNFFTFGLCHFRLCNSCHTRLYNRERILLRYP